MRFLLLVVDILMLFNAYLLKVKLTAHLFILANQNTDPRILQDFLFTTAIPIDTQK